MSLPATWHHMTARLSGGHATTSKVPRCEVPRGNGSTLTLIELGVEMTFFFVVRANKDLRVLQWDKTCASRWRNQSEQGFIEFIKKYRLGSLCKNLDRERLQACTHTWSTFVIMPLGRRNIGIMPSHSCFLTRPRRIVMLLSESLYWIIIPVSHQKFPSQHQHQLASTTYAMNKRYTMWTIDTEFTSCGYSS